jgi:hypothetical protein
MKYLGYLNLKLYTIDSGGALLFHDTYTVAFGYLGEPRPSGPD